MDFLETTLVIVGKSEFGSALLAQSLLQDIVVRANVLRGGGGCVVFDDSTQLIKHPHAMRSGFQGMEVLVSISSNCCLPDP